MTDKFVSIHFKLVILRRNDAIETLVASFCNEKFETALETDITSNGDTPEKENLIASRPRWMSKVIMERDPMIEALIKMCTPSRPAKRDRKHSTLKKTKSRLNHFSVPTTPKHLTKKTKLSQSTRKTKLQTNKRLDGRHEASIIDHDNTTDSQSKINKGE